MKVRILDSSALLAIPPAALAAYVRNAGWRKAEPYGSHGDIYAGENRPEIILPRTDRLADYAAVVSRLIGIFGDVNGLGEVAIYRDLLGANRDIIRLRFQSLDDDGSIPIDDGVDLVSHARELLLSAACAATAPQPVYRAGANRDAAAYMRRVRLGQTEQGSFVVTILTPVPPVLEPRLDPSWARIEDEPYERQVTRRLVDALDASRDAAEKAHAGDGASAFESAVGAGVSANLCGALAKLIEISGGLEIRVNWAKTRPAPELGRRIRFSRADAPAFREAARTFLDREPRTDQELFGAVHKLSRGEDEIEGRVNFKVDLHGRSQSVSAILDQRNYSVAIRAHERRNPVIVKGDLERIGQRWRMVKAVIREVAHDDEDEDIDCDLRDPPV